MLGTCAQQTCWDWSWAERFLLDLVLLRTISMKEGRRFMGSPRTGKCFTCIVIKLLKITTLEEADCVSPLPSQPPTFKVGDTLSLGNPDPSPNGLRVPPCYVTICFLFFFLPLNTVGVCRVDGGVVSSHSNGAVAVSLSRGLSPLAHCGPHVRGS